MKRKWYDNPIFVILCGVIIGWGGWWLGDYHRGNDLISQLAFLLSLAGGGTGIVGLFWLVIGGGK